MSSKTNAQVALELAHEDLQNSEGKKLQDFMVQYVLKRADKYLEWLNANTTP